MLLPKRLRIAAGRGGRRSDVMLEWRGNARKTLVGSLVGFALLVSAWDGGSSNPSRGGTTTGGAAAAPANLPELNVTVGAPVGYYSALWVAEINNLFQKEGVKVNVLTYSGIAVGAAQLATGQSDVLVNAITQTAGLKVKNIDVRVLMYLGKWDYHVTALVTNPSIASIGQLKAMGSTCQIATLVPGGGLYGFAVALKKVYNLDCRLVYLGSDAAMVAAYVSGAANAVTPNASDANTLKTQGKGNILLDPFTMDKATGEALVPKAFPFWSVAALNKTITGDKKVAVQRFIQALRDADALMEPMDAAQLAAVTVGVKAAFPGVSVDTMTTAYKLIKPIIPTGAQAGRISTDDWTAALKTMEFWQTPGVTAEDPRLAYAAVVDTAVFDATKTVPVCTSGQKPSADTICRPGN
jgi:hypothetical protein